MCTIECKSANASREHAQNRFSISLIYRRELAYFKRRFYTMFYTTLSSVPVYPYTYVKLNTSYATWNKVNV